MIVNSAIFIIFTFTFFKPRRARDAFSAFIVALFAEMYGIPLTIYVLSGWLQTRCPKIDWLSHDARHLLERLLGSKINPHFGPFHILSNILIIAGFMLIAVAWRVLHAAQRTGTLGTSGPYGNVRHPNIRGLSWFLLQWSILLTLGMFPVLVWMYLPLARQDEADEGLPLAIPTGAMPRRSLLSSRTLVKCVGSRSPEHG